MIAFGTVVYREALGFFAEFLQSIDNQTFKEFDLLIINDGVDESELKVRLDETSINSYVINNTTNLKPADLRVKLIEESKKRGYNLLVIGDCDDLFATTRVELIDKVQKKKPEYTFYYNELLRFDFTPAMKDIPSTTEEISQILQNNYIGMSNAALNLDKLSLDFIDSLKGCQSFVFDWYLFSRILCSGGKGVLVEKAITYYRIYSGNFVGLDAEVDRELEVKKMHYSMMVDYNPIYGSLLEKINSLDMNNIQVQLKDNSFWWNRIIL